MKTVNWSGVFPAVTTKFTPEDTLDLEMFKVNIKAQINSGVHGIILGGSLGEASTLNSEEKKTLVETTLELTDGKIPVILNIAEQSTKGAIEAASFGKNVGANGLMILPPMRYKADARETVTYFKAVANSTDLPIMIYNNPVDYGIEVTLDMFDELKECENIQAIKESTRDTSNVIRLRNKFGERFKILCGVDTLGLDELALGAHGWVAGLVCAFPRETVVIYELMKQNRYDEARAIFSWFLPLLELDIHSKLVQYIKLAEKATGIGTEYVRAPRLQIEGEELSRIQGVIDEGLRTRPQLPNV